jgi:hypothetical protein
MPGKSRLRRGLRKFAPWTTLGTAENLPVLSLIPELQGATSSPHVIKNLGQGLSCKLLNFRERRRSLLIPCPLLVTEHDKICKLLNCWKLRRIIRRSQLLDRENSLLNSLFLDGMVRFWRSHVNYFTTSPSTSCRSRYIAFFCGTSPTASTCATYCPTGRLTSNFRSGVSLPGARFRCS